MMETIEKKDSGMENPVKAAASPQQVHGSLKRLVSFKIPILASKLDKLDLQCFPVTTAPSWLTPTNLKGLKKLCIRGGNFSDLGPS